MLGRFIHNIFAAEIRNELSVAPFNHCSTICPYKKGVLIAWYAGSGECKNDQSVYIKYHDGITKNEPVRIGDKTGNPVLWVDDQGPILLWSYFEDDRGFNTRTPVDRWKFCSLWIQRISYENGIRFQGQPTRIVGPEQHLLGRCQPLKVGGHYLLPLYNEMLRCGVIYQINGLEAVMAGTIGRDMIQPTIWEHSGELYSLSRNFGKQLELYTKSSHSSDGGETWSNPQRTLIFNNNSSLCTVKWDDKHYLLWNNTQSMIRKNLTLGEVFICRLGVVNEMMPEVNSLCVIADRGSYPSMCVDAYNRLHMTYTTGLKRIMHRVWNKKCFERRRDPFGLSESGTENREAY